MPESVEIHGLVFTKHSDKQYTVLDLNYGMSVGTLTLEEGPGWLLTDMPTFLDYAHFCILAEFIKELNA